MTPSTPQTDIAHSARRPAGRQALGEVLLIWALAFGAILIARAIGPLSAYAKAVAAVAFLYLPGLYVWRRGEDYRDYGARLGTWKRDCLLGLKTSLLILPLFALGFWGFLEALSKIPPSLAGWVTPYAPRLDVSLRLPDRFAEHVLDQFLVVALPEEFFYRGYLQARLRDVWPGGRKFLGARLGPAFFLTALLFAVGHLAIFQVWRLSVFFPALVFGWLREKSDSILPGVVFHALSNLTLFVLEASFFGARL